MSTTTLRAVFYDYAKLMALNAPCLEHVSTVPCMKTFDIRAVPYLCRVP